MRSAIAALGLGTTLTLAGLASCSSPPGPIEPPGPHPSSTPVFASDAEALAAAEELYGRYDSITNQLGSEGWDDPTRLADVLAEDALQNEIDSAAELSAKGYRQLGESTFDSLTLQQLVDRGLGEVDITVYVCADVSDVDVVDEHNHSVVAESRPDRQPLEVEMNDKMAGQLKIVRREAWSGSDFC